METGEREEEYWRGSRQVQLITICLCQWMWADKNTNQNRFIIRGGYYYTTNSLLLHPRKEPSETCWRSPPTNITTDDLLTNQRRNRSRTRQRFILCAHSFHSMWLCDCVWVLCQIVNWYSSFDNDGRLIHTHWQYCVCAFPTVPVQVRFKNRLGEWELRIF